MKKITAAVIIVILILSFKTSSVETITLQQAINSGFCKISAEGTGEYNGFSINLTVESLTKKSLKIKIEAGSLFKPNDPSEQDLFMPEEETIFVQSKSTKSFPIKAYCSEHNDAAPDGSSIFSYTKTKNPQLLKLCKLTNKKGFDINTLQHAVWAISDNYDVSTIYSETDSRVKTLRKQICELTKQEDSWYNKKENLSIADNRSIISETESLESDIKVKMEKGHSSFSYKVYNRSDELQTNRNMDMNIPMSGIYTFKFKLQVYGWQQGVYSVDMFVGDKKIHAYEFEV